MKKSIFIWIAVILGAIVILTLVTSNERTAVEPTAPVVVPAVVEQNIDYAYLEENLLAGGPPKDGIPPIDEPKYITVEASNYLNDLEKVFVYEADEGVFIYPQRILVWHEIVNDVIDGHMVSITYCPLTGSTICYHPTDGYPENTYGTSGSLLNSNLVMYDRATDSYFPQILGIGITDDLKAVELSSNPIHWANWIDAKTAYPDAKVLSLETGFFRDYESDPYGSYLPDSDRTYYKAGGPIFPVLNQSSTFLEKKVVVGVKHNNAVLAIDPDKVNASKVIHFEIDDLGAVAFYDETLKTVRVFDASNQSFTPTEGGFLNQDDVFFSYKGVSENQILEPITYFDVMWFAWYAFYPETEVIR